MKKPTNTEEEKEEKIKNTETALIENLGNGTIMTRIEKLRLPGRFTLSALERNAIKELIKNNIEEGYTLSKERLYSFLRDELPELPRQIFGKLYKEAENEYFKNFNRIPREVLINKLTEQCDSLKERVLDESNEDITTQINAIAKLDNTIIKINKLEETPPVVEINFSTNLDENALINPTITIEKAVIVNNTEEKTNVNS